MSPENSAIDRRTRQFRSRQGRGRSTTKPGTLLKHSIPIRTFADWDDAKPGFLEMDLVAHCGESTEGQYLNTLTATDVTTAWTECFVLRHRSQLVVSAAMDELGQRGGDAVYRAIPGGWRVVRLRLMTVCLVETARAKGIDEPWLARWWEHINQARAATSGIAWQDTTPGVVG